MTNALTLAGNQLPAIGGGAMPFQHTLVAKCEGDYQSIERVNVTDHISLSIQGCAFSYCCPRKNIEPTRYTEMEVAIFRDGDWATLTRSAQNNLHCFDDGIFEGSWTSIFPYVPVATIQNLIDAIKADSSIVISINESKIEYGIPALSLSAPSDSDDFIEAEFVVE